MAHSHRPASDDVPDGFAELALLLSLSPAALAELLPAPVWTLPDTFDPGGPDLECDWWLAAGDHALVVVGVSADRLVVAIPRIRWESQSPVVEGASSEVLSPDEAADELSAKFRTLVAGAIHRRRSGFRRCRRCTTLTAPEHMFGGGICQGCAQDDGVVF